MRHEVQGRGEHPGESAPGAVNAGETTSACVRICEICAAVLSARHVTPRDRFLDLGGHSLSAMVATWRLRREFGVHVSIEEILGAPSMTDLARLIETRCALGADTESINGRKPAVESEPLVERIPLLPCQTGLWFLKQLDPASGAYNVPLLIRLVGPLDAPALKSALGRVVSRHDAFCLGFSSEDGEPYQVLARRECAPLAVADVDLSHIDAGEREAALHRHAAAQSREAFDLGRAPVARASLIRLDEQDHALLLVVHHIVCDEWSMDLLVRELGAAYHGVGAEHPAPSYARYAAAWTPDHARLRRDLAWWKERWREPPPALELPADRPRHAAMHPEAARVEFGLDAATSDALLALGRSVGLTPFATFLSIFYALLRRMSGQRDLVIGAPMSTRDDPDTEAMFGYLVHMVPLRLRFDEDPSFLDLMRAMRSVIAESQGHASMPLRTLVQELHPDRVEGQSPMVPVVFQYADYAGYDACFPGLRTRVDILGSGTSRFDLHCSLSRTSEGVRGFLDVAAAMFDADSVERMSRCFRTLVDSAIADPGGSIGRLPILSEPDRARVVEEFNTTATEYPLDATIHALFQSVASENPGRAAVEENGASITYAELDQRSNRLARHLQELGVARGDRVGIAVGRGLGYVVSVLATLKAGAAYVPLDPDYPAARLGLMLEDAAPKVVVRQGSRGNLPRVAGIAEVCLTDDAAKIHAHTSSGIESGAGAGDAAYVIYTSGSTGRPKGAVIPHRAVVRLVRAQRFAPFGPDQTHVLLAPTTFDASTFEMWGALLNAGHLLTCPAGVTDISSIRAMVDAGATVMWLTAALYNTIIDEAPDSLMGLGHLLIGGEALSASHVARGLRLLPTTTIINGYGPTECTTFACTFTIPRDFHADSRSAPIGRPIANTTAYVLDEHLHPVPQGVRGELCLGGDGLAISYLNAPELTREKFVEVDFLPPNAARLYRTGDLARHLPDGNIEFLGRVDDQLKIRGFRIEPGEIASALNAHPRVGSAAVISRPDPHGHPQLIAYFTCRDAERVSPEELAAYLRERLPAYMIPPHLVFLPRLPLGSSGKLDRSRLPAPPWGAAPSDDATPAPARRDLAAADPTEERLLDVWRRVLNVREIAPTDNFFDLGGHSLLAMKMFAVIERELGVQLPVSTIFRSPTARQLAAELGRNGPKRQSEDACVVPLRMSGRRPPVFLLSGIGGQVISLKPLIDRFATDRVCIGLEPPGMDAAAVALDTVEAIAAALLVHIRAEQPMGPYWLAGYSFGGVVAFEIGRQLREAGEQVASLLLIDSYPPRSFYPKPRAERLAIHLSRLLRSPRRELRLHAGRVLQRFTRGGAATPTTGEPTMPVQTTGAAAQRVARLCRKAYDSYVPREADLFAHVFVRTETPQWQEFMTGPGERSWAKYLRAGGSYQIVSGDHVSLVKHGHVDDLARAMNRCLQWDERSAPGGKAASHA